VKKASCVALIAAAFGVAACGGDSDQEKKELARARAQIAEERQTAKTEVAEAEAKVSDAGGQLAEKEAQIKRAQRRLERIRGEASSAQEAVDQNTIPGTGTFVVGEDIQPGTYRAEAQEGCYWKRLSSLSGDDIIDNNIADGPVVVEIKATDKAFETSDCADFHKVS
jgi:flagellar biosynthesis GTPase FlhF